MLVLATLVLYLTTSVSNQQGFSPQPFPVTITQTCPSAEEQAAITEDIQEQALSLLNSEIIPALENCACGGPALWTRIAHLNMSDPSQQCPSNWNLTTTPVRGCGRSNTAADTCDSAIFSSTGLSYSRVCGRITAYQRGSPDAFDPSVRGFFANNTNPGLEGAYVDGVSLTHGAAGSRQHIWTFAAALWESDPNYYSLVIFASCPCVNTNFTWPYEVPAFVGNSSYFCDTGNPGPGYQFETLYQDNPLWDDEGCGPTNACCEFNNPPWFCTTLPQATTNDLEMRICLDQDDSDEDVVISLIDLYVS